MHCTAINHLTPMKMFMALFFSQTLFPLSRSPALFRVAIPCTVPHIHTNQNENGSPAISKDHKSGGGSSRLVATFSFTRRRSQRAQLHRCRVSHETRYRHL